jgi:hypothetical protein
VEVDEIVVVFDLVEVVVDLVVDLLGVFVDVVDVVVDAFVDVIEVVVDVDVISLGSKFGSISKLLITMAKSIFIV